MAAVRGRAAAERERAAERWEAAVGAFTREPLGRWAREFGEAGRLTLNFHPDRICRHGMTVAEGLLTSGRYQSQWVTGLSAGSRSAIAGGERQRFERQLFDGAYDSAEMQDLQRQYSLATTPDQQKSIIDKVQALWYKDVPNVLFGIQQPYDVTHTYVKGFTNLPYPYCNFWNTWLDK